MTEWINYHSHNRHLFVPPTEGARPVTRGWLLREIFPAIFGQSKPRREPIKLPDDRGYGGPAKTFSGWPNLTYKDPWS